MTPKGRGKVHRAGRRLKLFFAIAHEPAQVDRQGNDVGRQYRSAIFYFDDMPREVAGLYMDQIERAGVFDAPLATQRVPPEAFNVAEDYQHDYAARNPDPPYIHALAQPKIESI